MVDISENNVTDASGALFIKKSLTLKEKYRKNHIFFFVSGYLFCFLLGLILGLKIKDFSFSSFNMNNINNEVISNQNREIMVERRILRSKKKTNWSYAFEKTGRFKIKNDDNSLTINLNNNKLKYRFDDYLKRGEEIYLNTALSLKPSTDKVTFHKYQIMYGQFLLPYYYNHHSNMKMLEIGLGCMMDYGPGASVKLHKKLFPKANLFESDYDEECIKKYEKTPLLENVNILVGDQANSTTLKEWIKTAGGDFDVVIDDGGHLNCQIEESFLALWPTVKKGGLYFIEDLHVSERQDFQRLQKTSHCDSTRFKFTERIKSFVSRLIFHGKKRFVDLKFVYCQAEACVIGKKD